MVKTERGLDRVVLYIVQSALSKVGSTPSARYRSGMIQPSLNDKFQRPEAFPQIWLSNRVRSTAGPPKVFPRHDETQVPKVKRRRLIVARQSVATVVNRRSSNCQNLSSSKSKFPLTPSTPMLFFPSHFGLMSASEAICLRQPPTQPGQRVKARTNCGGLPAGNTWSSLWRGER